VVVCGDSDAVIMALMLDPRADLTIDFGARNGILLIEKLQRKWLLHPLSHAGIQLGKEDHQIISGYMQVRICCTFRVSLRMCADGTRSHCFGVCS
jgi:hypothetical protein